MRSYDGSTCSVGGDALSEKIMQNLEEEIVFGRLKPGQKLPEEELSERFAASRHQVREALTRLQHVGIVIKERNKGVTVRRFSAEEVHQMYEVREMLQRQAALMIALPVPRAKIDRLRAIHADYEAAIAQGDYRAIHANNDRFHTEFFRLCGNEFLWRLVMQFMDLSYTIRANAFNPEHLAVARREHSVMISLLSTRESWGLSQLCVDHILYSKEQYLAFLESQEPGYAARRKQA